MENWTNGWDSSTSVGGTYIPWTGTTTTTGTYVMPMSVYGGGGFSPPPRQPTALEWLDAEIERTCALARAAP